MLRAVVGRRALALTVLLVALAAVWLPAGAGAGAAPCTRGELWVRVGLGTGGGAAGHVEYAILVVNEGTKACAFAQRPGLRLLGALGRSLPTNAVYHGPSGVITLARGAIARALAILSPDIPGPGEPTSGPCEPPADFVLVSLAAPGRGGVIGTIAPPTPVCEHGTLSLQAFTGLNVLQPVS